MADPVDALRLTLDEELRSGARIKVVGVGGGGGNAVSRMVQAGLRLEEIPITFVDREYGTSKMSVKIMAESMARVTTWGVRSRMGRDATSS